MAGVSPTSQIHAGKCFWRPGEEHAVRLLISALESIPHLLAHLAATPEVYTWDILLLVNGHKRPVRYFCDFNVFMVNGVRFTGQSVPLFNKTF